MNYIKSKYNFVETPLKFIIAIINLRSFIAINLGGVSTKLYFNLIFTTQLYKELITVNYSRISHDVVGRKYVAAPYLEC